MSKKDYISAGAIKNLSEKLQTTNILRQFVAKLDKVTSITLPPASVRACHGRSGFQPGFSDVEQGGTVFHGFGQNHGTPVREHHHNGFPRRREHFEQLLLNLRQPQMIARGVLAVTLHDASPPRVVTNVDHGAVYPLRAAQAHLARGHRRGTTHEVGIQRARCAERYLIGRDAAVNDVAAHQSRYAEPRTVDQRLLIAVGKGGILRIQNIGSHVQILFPPFLVEIFVLAARTEEHRHQLPHFFVERQALHQVVSAVLRGERAVAVGQRFFACHSGHGQERKQENGE